jgi:hypothetical protein
MEWRREWLQWPLPPCFTNRIYNARHINMSGEQLSHASS